MNDDEVMQLFIEMLNTRVGLNTAFVQDNDTGNITHQVVRITCGELVSMSSPELLEMPMRPALAEEVGASVN